MSTEGSLPRDRDTSGTSEEVELARVLESYLAQLEAGRPADPEGLIAAHPELARPLRACLKVMHLAQGLDQSGELPAGPLPVDRDMFGAVPPPGSSALTVLWPAGDGPPRVLLPEPLEDDSAIVRTYCDGLSAPLGGAAGRYQVLGEIARGGMGMVLKARDADLGRDLALKVLLDRHRGDQDVVRRFVEEAQIGGQLQHPGIVPVHELGTLDDLRPFFTMRLVKGRTLAALLSERPLAHRANLPHPNPPPQRGDSAKNSSPLVGEDTGGGAGTRTDRGPDQTPRCERNAAPDETSDNGQGTNDKGPVATGGLLPTPDDLPRFLSIFEVVCQTMAYAHARRVIHRDLKPANVMVGSFGEVQVMDWGLAKVLAEGGIADEARAIEKAETAVLTVRSGSAGSGSESQAGSVLGTPAYMAPEQARGDVEQIDERADVFGLGAILCEILTGRPPYVGSTREEIRDKAARGNLADALARLDASGADADLIGLARDCLAAERHRRPRNAGAVVQRLTSYLAGVQERLKTAELARVEAQARAEEETKRRAVADELAREARARADEERKRRRMTAALAASVLVTFGLVSGGWSYLARQRAARLIATTRAVSGALAESERLRGQAQSAAAGDLAKWSEALGAAKRARDLLAEGEADDALHARVMTTLADLAREQTAAEKQAAEAERDGKLLGELEAIRCNRSEHWDRKQTDIDYAAAFRGFGIDLDQLDPEEAGKQIARRSSPVELASYLDDWAVHRRKARDKKDETSWRRLLAAARAADPDPWRAALRDQIGSDDLEALVRLSDNEKELDAQSPQSLELLAGALVGRGDRVLAERVLRRAWRIKPDDFWVSYSLAEAYYTGSSHDRLEEAVRFYSVAVAIRPRSPAAHNDLGSALIHQGKVDEAMAEYREAIRIRPDLAIAHNNLGATLCDFRHDYDGAITEFRTAIHLKPDLADAHGNLGIALRYHGELELAVAEFREAIRLKPDYFNAHSNLGLALAGQGRLDEAVAEYREAIRLKPDLREAHLNLGFALRSLGEFTGAVAELRKAHDLAKSNAALARQTEQDVIATEQHALMAARLPAILTGKLKPADAAETLGFAQLCYDRKRYGHSARFWTEAFRAEPKLADDMQAQYRYNAACAAALAGSGQGKDDPPLDEPTKARWRKQAIDWLKADLAAWSKVLEKGPPAARQSISQTLKPWKVDSDLAGLRDAVALARLPEAEQKACRALWAEVEALLKNTGATKP